MSPFLFQGGEVDYEAVFYVAFDQAVVGVVYFLDGDDLDIGGDFVFGAEVEHFLSFADAAYKRAGERPACAWQGERRYSERARWNTEHHESSVAVKEIEILIHIELDRNGVENKVEFTGEFIEHTRFRCIVKIIRSEAFGVFLLFYGMTKYANICSHSVREFDCHVAQASETEDGDFFAGAGIPVAKGRIGRDACAEQGGDAGCGKIFWDFQGVIFIDDDAGRVSAECRGYAVFFHTVIRPGNVMAILFEAVCAFPAFAAGIGKAAHAGEVAFFETFGLRACLDDCSDDFVSGDHRVMRAAPFVADLVDVGMTDAAILNVD